MSIASASHGYVFGIKNNLRDSIYYLEENTILYPAGSNIVIYDVESNAQKFIPVPEHGDGISAVTVSADRMMMAVAEASQTKPSISIFELNSHRKRKTLHAENSTAKEFASLSFSVDSKYLAAQSSGPDFLLSYFAWEKGKAIATIPSAPHGYNGTLRQIAINPYDATEISVLGEGLFKIFRYAEGVLRPTRGHLPPRDYRCHTWIQSETIALATGDGHIYIVADGAIVQDLPFILGVCVESLAPLTKGFVAGGHQGAIIIYEQLVTDAKKSLYEMKQKIQFPEQETNIQTLVVSSSQGEVLVQTSKNQICQVSLEPAEGLKKKEDDALFKPLTHSFHVGSIKGMDVCSRKPLLITCGADKSIRIWNYITGKCEQVKFSPEEVSSVALHPSGLYLLAGFSDKLRLMNILMDDIRPFREFPIRVCQECRFSNGGHLFAATHGNLIQIQSVWTFETVAVLKGHNGKVRSLYFTPNDTVLVSAGSDGAVYTWSMQEFKRESEHILKTCSYSSAVCSPSGKTVYAVGIDRMLKEITESSVTREIDANTILTQVALSHSGRMMFVGTSSGGIRAIKFPLSDASDFQEHEAHSGPITKFRISYDDQYLFSASDDGCIYVFKIADKDEHSLKRDKGIAFSDEILITKSDLEEKTVLMSELQRSLEELKLEHEYQLRLKDMNFNEKLKEITDRYSQEIEALKISTSVARTEKDKEDIKHQEELQNIRTKLIQEIHDAEAKNNQKLMEEYDKFQTEQERTNRLQEGWQTEMRRYEEDTQQELIHTQSAAESHLNVKATEITKLRDQSQEQIKELKEIVLQNEEDIDSEIYQLLTRYEKKVKSEKEEGARLKGENGIMRKKFNTLNKDIEENKTEILRMAENEKKLQSVIAGFEKDIQNLRKEMAERDEHIQDKEKKVYDLKKRNQELEKFKFVLDFRIKELKEQVEPRENEIAEMTMEINGINTELDRLAREKRQLEENIEDLKKGLGLKKQQYTQEHSQAHRLNHQIKSFKKDLQDAVAYFQDPVLLKKSFENLRKKYCSKAKDLTGNRFEAKLKEEYQDQQQFLRTEMANLRVLSGAHSSAFHIQNVQSVMENRELIREIGRLRGISKVRAVEKRAVVVRQASPDLLESTMGESPTGSPTSTRLPTLV